MDLFGTHISSGSTWADSTVSFDEIMANIEKAMKDFKPPEIMHGDFAFVSLDEYALHPEHIATLEEITGNEVWADEGMREGELKIIKKPNLHWPYERLPIETDTKYEPDSATAFSFALSCMSPIIPQIKIFP